jgi:hypothetical protein
VPYLKTYSILQSRRAVVSSEEIVRYRTAERVMAITTSARVIRDRFGTRGKSLRVRYAPFATESGCRSVPSLWANCRHFRTDHARAVVVNAW